MATSSGHYWTAPDLAVALQQWHGISYRSASAYRKLLQRCGFGYQRATRVFRSRRAEQVADFAEQEVVTREQTMNSAATTAHLQQLLATYPKEPILMLWDRASWHGGAAVRAVLVTNPRLEIMQLPTAAPDLNPQEMVWKATRAAISHNHAERRLASLADRFEHHLKATTFFYSLLEKFDHSRMCARFS